MPHQGRHVERDRQSPPCPRSSRNRYRSFVSAGVPNPANCRIVHRRPAVHRGVDAARERDTRPATRAARRGPKPSRSSGRRRARNGLAATASCERSFRTGLVGPVRCVGGASAGGSRPCDRLRSAAATPRRRLAGQHSGGPVGVEAARDHESSASAASSRQGDRRPRRRNRSAARLSTSRRRRAGAWRRARPDAARNARCRFDRRPTARRCPRPALAVVGEDRGVPGAGRARGAASGGAPGRPRPRRRGRPCSRRRRRRSPGCRPSPSARRRRAPARGRRRRCRSRRRRRPRPARRPRSRRRRVVAGRVEDADRLGSGERHPTEMSARGHRPDEHAGVGGVLLHPDAVAQQRAAGVRGGRIDREHRDRAVRVRARTRTSPAASVDFPTPGAPVRPIVEADARCGRRCRRTAPRGPASPSSTSEIARADRTASRASTPAISPSTSTRPKPTRPTASEPSSARAAAPGIAPRASRSERQYARCAIRAGSSTVGAPSTHHREVHLLALEAREQRPAA